MADIRMHDVLHKYGFSGLADNFEREKFVVDELEENESSVQEESKRSLTPNLIMIIVRLFWTLTTIYFRIFNKQRC